MAWYYETFGVKGLAYMMVQIAVEEAREEHRTWRAENGQATEAEDAASGEEALASIGTLDIDDAENVGDVVNQQLQDKVIQDPEEGDEVDEHEGSCFPFAGRWTLSQKPLARVRSSASAGDILSPTTAGGSSSALPSTGDEAAVLDLEGVHCSWKLIIEDWVACSGLALLYYLSQLHPKVIVALINGDLASKMQDSAFPSEVQAYLTPSDRQGTYAVFVSIQRTLNQLSAAERNLARQLHTPPRMAHICRATSLGIVRKVEGY